MCRIYPFISLYVCFFIYVLIYICVWMYLYLYKSVCGSICEYIYVALCECEWAHMWVLLHYFTLTSLFLFIYTNKKLLTIYLIKGKFNICHNFIKSQVLVLSEFCGEANYYIISEEQQYEMLFSLRHYIGRFHQLFVKRHRTNK